MVSGSIPEPVMPHYLWVSIGVKLSTLRGCSAWQSLQIQLKWVLCCQIEGDRNVPGSSTCMTEVHWVICNVYTAKVHNFVS